MTPYKIFCTHCQRTITVRGRIWEHRLRNSVPDSKGIHHGWYCDACTDKRERGWE